MKIIFFIIIFLAAVVAVFWYVERGRLVEAPTIGTNPTPEECERLRAETENDESFHTPSYGEGLKSVVEGCLD
jgi:hypothetical protein